MIENLPDVSRLRYRGEPVEWRDGVYLSGWRLMPAGAEPHAVNYVGAIFPVDDGFQGCAFDSADGESAVGGEDVEHDDVAIVAAEIIRRLLSFNVVTEIDVLDDGGRAFILSPELLALASAVAQRQGRSLDDLLTRIVTTKVVSIAVVDYRDDPEIRRLHINLAESWGRR